MKINLCVDGRVHKTFVLNEVTSIVPAKVGGKDVVLLSSAAGSLAMLAPAVKGLNLMGKLSPLVSLLQDLALPVSIAVATWGVIEIMLGNPGGKTKIKLATLGYIAIFVIPMAFEAIHDAFRG